MKHMLLGVTLLFLLVLLIGCATPKPDVIRIPFETIVIEKVRVPDELLRQCRSPNLDSIETTGDIEGVAIEALASLETCNQDKERIRAWQEVELP